MPTEQLVQIRRNVMLWDRGIVETAPGPPAPNNETRLFFNNPLQNSRSRTPGSTNMQQPGQIPAQSYIKIYALGLFIESRQPQGVEDPASSAAFRDLIQLLRSGTFEFFVGSSNDARLAIPLSEILQTLDEQDVALPTGWPAQTTEIGTVSVGKRDNTLGILYPLRGDVIEVAALQTFSMLIAHQETLQGLTYIDPVITGVVQCDVIGALAEQFGSFA